MRRAAKSRRVLTSLQPARPEARAEVPLWRGPKTLNEPSRRVEDLVRIEIPRCPPIRGRKHTQTAGPLGKSKHQQPTPRATRQTSARPCVKTWAALRKAKMRSQKWLPDIPLEPIRLLAF